MGASSAGDVVSGDEMNPSLARRVVPDDGREVDVMEGVAGKFD